MALKTFLLLPEHDDAFFSIAENEIQYANFIKNLAQLTKEIRQNKEATLFYDAQNIQTFIAKCKTLQEGDYLVDDEQLIRHLGLSREASDIQDETVRDTACVYFLWDFDKIKVENSPALLAEMAERIWSFPAEKYLLLNFQNALETTRKYLCVFKDALHEATLPATFAHLPFITDKAELELWLATNNEQHFSLLDRTRFRRTREVQQGKPVFEEIKTGYFWYMDNLHKNEYEVFNAQRKHIGVADLQGIVNFDEAKEGRIF